MAIILPYFARHETFHPRFGWLKKGFDKVKDDSNVFNRADAPVILGVGKNMVRAIRYWCWAFKVIEEYQEKSKHYYRQSEPGEKLLAPNGYDQYLEDPASLWLLHWNLLKNPCYATTWYYTFNHFQQAEFTVDDLLSSLVEYKEKTYPTSPIVKDSLNKDVTCLLRMYAEQKNTKGFLEDSIDSPFVELGLIHQSSDSRYYSFNIGNKTNLPYEIIVYTCLKFAFEVSNETRSINISRLLYEEGSPGFIFKLTQGALLEAIEHVASYFKGIALSDTAGVIQFFYYENPGDLAEKLLNFYYSKSSPIGGKD